MSRTDGEGAAAPPPSRDRSDAALDAALSAANAGMVAAIRRGFDLDAGLAGIVGAPPEVETCSAEPLAGTSRKRVLSFAAQPNSGWPQADAYMCAVDIGTQIARLRLRVLELVQQHQVGGSAMVLLRAAAGNLQELHRGLEGRALSRQAAGKLLDTAGLALETASDVEASEMACPPEGVPSEDSDYPAYHTGTGTPLLSEKRVFRKRPSLLTFPAPLLLGTVLVLALAIALFLLDMSWLRGVLAVLELKRYDAAEAAVIAVNVAILALLMFKVPRRLFRVFRRRSARIAAVTEAIKARAALQRQVADASVATAVLKRSLPPGDGERAEASAYITLLNAVAKLQRPPADAATSRIDVLREELDGLRPNVMKLFDGAGDCSPCAPLTS